MIIKTKYNIGDKVYYLDNNKIKCTILEHGFTCGFSPFTPRKHTEINYIVEKQGGMKELNYIWKWEKELFKTKEDLLKSL